MRIKITEVEHTEPLGIPALRIFCANVTHVRRFIESETSDRVLHDHFFGDSFGAGLEQTCRGITLRLLA